MEQSTAIPKTQTAQRTKALKLIGAASGWGAQDHRCDTGPETLRAAGIDTVVKNNLIQTQWSNIIRPSVKNKATADPSDYVSDLCNRLAHTVFETVNKDEMFAVFGGDHSCAIGTWSGAAQALKQSGPLGLIWVDAHMDSHSPDTTPSGALHGMPLACLLGFGPKNLCQIGYPGPKLAPEHVCLIGVRCFEPDESALLKQLGVRVFSMTEVKKRGLDNVMRDALSIVKAGTSGFGLSIDLDAVDPVDAPGVGSPEQNGIPARFLINALSILRNEPALVGVEIAEFNPFLDVKNKTVDLCKDLLRAIF
jgi:arginase